MTGAVVVVQGAGIAGPGPVEDVLAARRRPTRVDAVPAGPQGVRALILRGDPGAAALPGIAACAAAGVPVLAIGAAAAPAAEAVGAPIPEAPHTPAPTNAVVTGAGAAHPVAGALPQGAQWIADRVLGPAGEAWDVLAADLDGHPVLLERGAMTVTALRCDLSAAELEAHLPGDARFVLAVGASLVGRWVDRVVGRTAEETPWGRRGPGPVPRPGLFLHPA